MKFVHMADLHLDSKFESLSKVDGLAGKRRMEQRQALRNVVEFVKENDVEILIIAGDLYEQNYIRKSSIEYVNSLFEEIPNTQVIITPGNHDPYITNSFYNTFKWAKNVYIFSGDAEKIDVKGIHVYGMAFTDFYCRENKIEEIKIDNPDDINILAMHGTLDAAIDQYNHRDYNPVKKSTLEKKGFDYVALGHVHKPYFEDEENQKVCYCGSLLSLGFDEPGKHGFILGTIKGNEISKRFVPIDQREFCVEEIDITQCYSNEDIIDKINKMSTKENDLYEVILVGKRSFIINKNEISKMCQNSNIVKIKDKTQIGIDINEISNEQSVRGIFVKNMLSKIDNEGLDEDYVIKAIEIGLEVLK